MFFSFVLHSERIWLIAFCHLSEVLIMYYGSIGMHERWSEREQILVAGSILWSMMGTVCFVVRDEGSLS